MVLGRLIDNVRAKKARFRDAQDERQIHQTLDQREKSSNERELEEFQIQEDDEYEC